MSAGNLNNATAIGANAIVNASNKVRLGNASVTVIEGQVAFTFPSDKTKKENFQPVDGEAVLGKIRGFELSSWNFIGHDPERVSSLRSHGARLLCGLRPGRRRTDRHGDDDQHCRPGGDSHGRGAGAGEAHGGDKQKEAQIAVLASKVEELTAKYAYLETVAARLEGVMIGRNVLVRADRVDE